MIGVPPKPVSLCPCITCKCSTVSFCLGLSIWLSPLGLHTPNRHAIDLSATILVWIVAMDDHVVVRLAVKRSYPLDGAVNLVFVSSGCVRTHICNNTESAPILKSNDHKMPL